MRQRDIDHLDTFLDNGIGRPTLGLLYGRRRIGKSTELARQARSRDGFYFEAIRAANPIQLRRLGEAIGLHQGVGRIALDNWEQAVAALIDLGKDRPIPVVIDEFGYIVEADVSVPSIMATALGPDALHRTSSQSRIVLCGSAISVMRSLTEGSNALRGRAGMELLVHPDDFRMAATRLPHPPDRSLAVDVFGVIGGVVGYATDMVGFDLPSDRLDFDRWVTTRILSNAATLHSEPATLLAEDPTTSGRSSLVMRSILGSIANGRVTAGRIAQDQGRSVANLSTPLSRLIDAGFVVRHEDPVRAQRPLYGLSDSMLQFHFAVLEPHGELLRSGDLGAIWKGRLEHTYQSLVRGPVFEEQTRTWVRIFADSSTVPVSDHVGPSSFTLATTEYELDVVAVGSGSVPGERTVTAIGEAKSGEKLTLGHLHKLEAARNYFGTRGKDAKLLLFGPSFDASLVAQSRSRSDVEIIDFERLYSGC